MHHLVKLVANTRLVDLNDLSHPFGLLVIVYPSSSLKVCLEAPSKANVRKILYVIGCGD